MSMGERLSAVPARTTKVPTAALDLSKRDLVVDLVRVVCVLLVVLIHLLMVGVAVSPSGSLAISSPIEEVSWYIPVAWIAQIMPVFFVVGGFASYTAWQSTQRKGGTGADFLRGRILRLVRPSIPVFIFFALALSAATPFGVPQDFLNGIASGTASPLWFLAAYLICQSFVPLMARLHERAPVGTMVALLLGAIVVDVIRAETGIMDVGLLNLVFVWLLVQQIGFCYATGWFDARPWWLLLGIAAGAYAVLGILVAFFHYSPDMLAVLNPPQVPLILLGIAQVCLLKLAHPFLNRLMQRRSAQSFVFVAGSRAMTIYLWHLPVMIVLVGLWLLSAIALPTPLSAAWWWSRIPFYFLTLGVVYLLSLVAARLELAPTGAASWTINPSAKLIGLAAVAAIIPPLFVAAQFGMNIGIAWLGALLLPASLVLVYVSARARRG